jgi:ankyrin repeat protein
LDIIPPEDIREELLVYTDSYGRTFLHWAAVNDQLHLIPKKLLQHKYLLQKDKDSESVYYCAAKNHTITKIPKRLITKSVLLEANKYGDKLLHLIPVPAMHHCATGTIDEEIAGIRDNIGGTYLHALAAEGLLKLANKETLTKKYLEAKDTFGGTVYHSAAMADIFQLPKQFITSEMLCIENMMGVTPLHIAASVGSLLKLDEVINVTPLISMKDEKDNSVLHHAGPMMTIDYKKFWTKDNLIQQNYEGDTPINLIVDENVWKFALKTLNIYHWRLLLNTPLNERRKSDVRKEISTKMITSALNKQNARGEDLEIG